jgi:transposase
VFWHPIYNILEDEERTIILVNVQHMKAVPGRKTDVKDSEWLADLLRHGLRHPPALSLRLPFGNCGS